MKVVLAKECPSCATMKPTTEFSKNISSADGLQTYCRVCSTDRVGAFLRRNRDGAHRERKQWTQQELKTLQDNTLSLTEMATTTGRSYSAVASQRQERGYTAVRAGKRFPADRHHQSWTDSELATIQRRDITTLQMSQITGRSHGAVRMQRSLRGYTRELVGA